MKSPFGPSSSDMISSMATSEKCGPRLRARVGAQTPAFYGLAQFKPAIWTLLVVLVIPHTSAVAQTTTDAEEEPATTLTAKDWIDRVKLSKREVASELKSAFGSGTLLQIIHEAGTDEPVTLLDTDLQFFYDEPKFRLHLVHHQRLREAIRQKGEPDENFERWVPSDVREQIVLYDGEKVCSLEVQSSGRCVGTIYFGFAKTGVMRSAGFPFENPADLWSRAFTPQDIDFRRLTVTPLADGGFVGLIRKTTYQVKFVFLDQFGYDLRRVSSCRIGETQPFRDFLLTWDKSNEVRYVRRLVNTVTTAHGDTSSSAQTIRRLEVEFDRFEANTDIGPAVFDLSSIQIPDGTPFFDKRANVEGGPKRYVYRNAQLEPVELSDD